MTPTAITSTGIRQTPSLTVPSTQNTAPVLEFRCLYSHDLRRKQKRWQDGLLRYHTFNKRVMVYEVSRNYIGDTHRRDDDAVYDGDEFELDRGVLVQVGEAMGSVDQDLTELLEKRRKTHDAESPRHTAPTPGGKPISAAITVASVRSTLGQPSQLRPKSLNALLGTPKGRAGRAAPPTKSPYEKRNEDKETENRPAKRQRIESPVERALRPAKALNTREPTVSRLLGESGRTNCVADKQQYLQRSPDPIKERTLVPLCTAAIKATRSGVQQSTGIAPSKPPMTHTANGALAVGGRAKTIGSTERGEASEELTEVQKYREKPRELYDGDAGRAVDRSVKLPPTAGSLTKQKIGIEPIEIVSDDEAVSINGLPKEKTKLQIAARKPRKKLMYKDLLPQERPTAGGPLTSIPRKERERRGSSTATRARRRPKDALVDRNQEEQDRLADRLNRVNGRSNYGSSDLFLTQEEDEVIPSIRHRMKEKAFESIELTPNDYSIGNASDQALDCAATIPKAPSTVHDTALTLSEMDEILFPRSRTSPPAAATTTNSIAPSTLPKEHSPPPVPQIPPDLYSHPHTEIPPPITLVPSSPGFQTQAPRTPPKTLHTKASSPKPSTPKILRSQSPNLEPSILNAPSPNPQTPRKLQSPTHQLSVPNVLILPHPAALPAPKPPSPIHRPFKPPRVRSPLKKSIADTTNMGSPAPLSTRSKPASKAQELNTETKNGNGGSLWTKEAWDLFGCGRDGVECTYEEFRMKEGLV